MQRLAIALLTSLVAAGCSDAPRDYEPIATLVAKADTVTLYEGLPHQVGEPELLNQELAEKKTFEFGGHPFYAEPMPLSDEDAKTLTDIFDNKDAFGDEAAGGWGTKCGPFHPDFAIEWATDDDVVRIQICFGCSEAKIYSGTSEAYLSLAATEKLRALLKDRWQHRPKTPIAKMWRF
jgi:hypothetical protein